MIRKLVALGVVGLGMCACAAEQVEVRVRQTPAGPQIFVDGSPRAPRMLWVRDSTARQHVGADWNAWSGRFQATYDVTAWRFSVRFSPRAGVLHLRNVTARGSDGSSFTIWDKLDLNTNGPKPAYTATTSKLPNLTKGVVYTVSLEARAEGDITWFCPCAEPTGDGRYHWWLEELPWQDERLLTSGIQTKLAAQAGVDFVTYFAPMGWETPGDWTEVDACNDRILAANPNALLIPRISLVPPDKWYATHPDAPMKMHDGSYSPHRFPSIHYAPFRTEMRQRLTAYLRHMMAKYPRNFAGVHATGQNTSEWFYYDSWSRMCGYDAASLAAWRKWLKAKGAPDAEWAAVPPPEDRRAFSAVNRLFDPADPAQARCVEYVDFLNDSMVDLVNEVNRICRRETAGKKLVVSFYGYAWEFASAQHGPANTGHYGLMKLLREGGEYVDILSSPLSYMQPGRTWCGWTPMMAAVETVQRHGVLWVHEDDSRTHLDPRLKQNVQEGATLSQGETYDLLRRNDAYEAVRGHGSWWMDLYGHGWHTDPAVWKAIPDGAAFEQALMRRAAPYSPDVALILDERAMRWMNCGSKNAVAPVLLMGRTVFAQTGTGLGQYLLEDVIARPIAAKLQMHLASWRLSDAEIAALVADRAARPDVTRVWCWAPAYIGAKGFDITRSMKLTGFALEPRNTPKLDAVATAEGRAMGFPESFGLTTLNYGGKDGTHAPKLAVRPEAGDRVLANWTDGTPAVVARQNAGGTGWNVFFGPTVYTREIANALVRLAGVHCYLAKPDGKASLIADGNFAALQAFEDGPRTVVWPDGSRETFTMRKGEVKTLIHE